MEGFSASVGIVKTSGNENNFEHCSEASKAKLALLKGQKYCDVIFRIGPEKKEMKCHKLILSSRSPVFEVMFSDSWDSSEEIILEEVLPETFELFLEYIYADKFTESIPEAIKVLQLADKYDVRPLVQKCEELISQDIKLEDAVQTYIVARSYSLKKLMQHAGDLMAREFIGLCKDASSFGHLDEDTLIYLLKRDDLAMAECDVFTTLLRWANKQIRKASGSDKESSYTEVLQNIIPLVRFPRMTPEEFSTVVFPTGILSQKDVVDLILYFRSDETIRDEVAKRIRYSTEPRKCSVGISLYEAASPDMVTAHAFNSAYDSFKYVFGHESKLEFIFKSGVKVRKDNVSQCVELASLFLQGMETEEFQEHCPTSPGPHTELVLVYVETLGDAGEGLVFTSKCLLTKGRNSELQVEPPVKLVDGSKYRITVSFQGETLVISTTGERGHANPNYDKLTSSTLKTTVSELMLAGAVDLEGLQMISPPSELGHYYNRWNYHMGPLGLHVVKGMKLTATI